MYLYILTFVSVLQFMATSGRKHYLRLENEQRPIIHISQFGFFHGGILEVYVNALTLKASTIDSNTNMIGFTVDRTLTDGITPYPHTMDTANCALRQDLESLNEDGVQRIAFAFDLKANIVNVGCSRTMDQVKLYSNVSNIPFQNLGFSKNTPAAIGNQMLFNRKKRDSYVIDTTVSPIHSASDKSLPPKPEVPVSLLPEVEDTNKKESATLQKKEVVKEASKKSKEAIEEGENEAVVRDEKKQTNTVNLVHVPEKKGSGDESVLGKAKDPGVSFLTSSCKGHIFPLRKTLIEGTDLVSFSTQFVVYVATEESEGSYNLYFHHCGGESLNAERVTLDLKIVEQNRDRNYLSADEIPLPALYSMMSILFFISGCFWAFILKKSRQETGVAVYKIHYLMASLVFIKSLSLLFHAINFHFIELYGTHVEAWAILYYVTNLLKGALLFITILLIGTGYAFVKHLLSDKDKKIIMIVIPLQILSNVAEIMTTEVSEEGQMVHATWKIIFISVDLLCCGAILFPVVWSIRHLQEASQTDGKAASNLRKLKLFRHFYMIVVCYIYFTRIIVHMLLKITVPFEYKWLDPMVYEMATFIFFVLCGYKFRPAKNNPYLQLAHDSDDEMDVALTESGLTAGVIKRGSSTRKKKTLKEMIIFDPNEEDTDDDEEVLLEKRREASHDFD